VARLTVPRLAVDQIVLAGASGRTLAFGPALSPAGAAIGGAGTAVLSGHRDTHFTFLRELVAGDRIWLDTPQGRVAYVIEQSSVVDARSARLATAGEGARLVLVTCWPFDAVEPRGPWRYVVEARLFGVTVTDPDSVLPRSAPRA
jgi:sortase A